MEVSLLTLNRVEVFPQILNHFVGKTQIQAVVSLLSLKQVGYFLQILIPLEVRSQNQAVDLWMSLIQEEVKWMSLSQVGEIQKIQSQVVVSLQILFLREVLSQSREEVSLLILSRVEVFLQILNHPEVWSQSQVVAFLLRMSRVGFFLQILILQGVKSQNQAVDLWMSLIQEEVKWMSLSQEGEMRKIQNQVVVSLQILFLREVLIQSREEVCLQTLNHQEV